MKPRFLVHTTTVIHKEYVVQGNKPEDVTSEWLALIPAYKETVVCSEAITHIKCINDYEYHNEYNSGMKPMPMNDPVEGSRYEIERGKEDDE